MHKQMDYICNEIDELEAKIEKDGGLTKPDVQYLDTLWHLKKDMLASSQMEENDYSNDSGMSREGSYRGSYADSYDDGSYRDERSYARGRTRAPRDSMGRYVGYSRKGEDVIEVLDDLRGIVRKLPNDAKYEVERIIKKHENVHA